MNAYTQQCLSVSLQSSCPVTNVKLKSSQVYGLQLATFLNDTYFLHYPTILSSMV